MYIFMDPFLLKSGGQTEMIITLPYAILLLSLLFKCENVEFFNCQGEQGTRQKTTQKNFKKFPCRNRLERVYYVINMQSLL